MQRFLYSRNIESYEVEDMAEKYRMLSGHKAIEIGLNEEDIKLLHSLTPDRLAEIMGNLKQQLAKEQKIVSFSD
jgi:hypothetical protein